MKVGTGVLLDGLSTGAASFASFEKPNFHANTSYRPLFCTASDTVSDQSASLLSKNSAKYTPCILAMDWHISSQSLSL